MADITLLASRQARAGFEFTYEGPAPVCRTCPFRHACLTLDVGRRYQVTHVRPVQHPCALQETVANVVEVKPIARAVVVDAPAAIVGSSVEVGRYGCTRLDCPTWYICAGPSVPPRQLFRVLSVEPVMATASSVGPSSASMRSSGMRGCGVVTVAGMGPGPLYWSILRALGARDPDSNSGSPTRSLR